MNVEFWRSDVKKPRATFPASFLPLLQYTQSLQWTAIALLLSVSVAHANLHARAQSSPGESALPVQYFTQAVNHDDPQDAAVFHQRFWQQSRWWNPHPSSGASPLVILQVTSLASETYTPEQMNTSALAVWAQELDAMLVTIESRYSGESVPLRDYNTTDLRFNTVDQHLQDLLVFITNRTQTWGLASTKTRWILIGSLFDGAYVTWFRSRFPDASFGTIALSPYLVATPQNTGFDTAFGNYIAKSCVSAVHDAWTVIEAAYATYSSAQKSAYQASCGCAFNMTTGDAEFFFTASAAIMGQFGWNTAFVCNNLTAAQAWTPSMKMTNMANLLQAIFTTDYVTCEEYDIALDTTQQSFRSELYLQCAELGQFETSNNSTTSLIPASVTVSWFKAVCAKLYSHVLPDNTNYELFNADHGGAEPEGCNMVFVVGKNDAYRSLGPSASLSAQHPSNQIVTVTCSGPEDTLSVLDKPAATDSGCTIAARAQVLNILRAWQTDTQECQLDNVTPPKSDSDDDSGKLALVGVLTGVGAFILGVLIGAIVALFVARVIYVRAKRSQWQNIN